MKSARAERFYLNSWIFILYIIVEMSNSKFSRRTESYTYLYNVYMSYVCTIFYIIRKLKQFSEVLHLYCIILNIESTSLILYKESQRITLIVFS